MTDITRSWLIQRLEKPRGSGLLDKAVEAFSFGGGLLRGGLSDEAFDLLRGIFSFDYMGAAEFEFGAVPKALQSLARSHADLAATTFEIPLSQVSDGWRKAKAAPTGQATIYVLAPAAWTDEVERRVRTWAAEGYRAELKEPTLLESTLKPREDFDGRAVGWLELDNGFMFFTDREMWEKTAALFGVKVPAVSR